MELHYYNPNIGKNERAFYTAEQIELVARVLGATAAYKALPALAPEPLWSRLAHEYIAAVQKVRAHVREQDDVWLARALREACGNQW